MRRHVRSLLDAARERNLTMQWLAGLVWTILTIFGIAIAGALVLSVIFAFVAPAAFVTFVLPPGIVAYGIWVQRSVLAAIGGAFLSTLAAIAIAGGGALLVGALATIPGLLAALAAREIRNANLAASALRRAPN